MTTFLALFTYFAYIFIIAMYTRKAVKYLRLPTHIRWELYPVIHEEQFERGGSVFENQNWWTRERRTRRIKGFFFLLKEYFSLGEYLKRNPGYWLFLYPWHVGFMLIITFHILCFFGAVALIAGVTVAPDSPHVIGVFFYYAILLAGVASFVTGAFGSAGLMVKRWTDQDLRAYASPFNFVTYAFTLAVFLSGLYAWYAVDPGHDEYRGFWKGLLTLSFVPVEPGTAIHIILFNIFLIYLPFTRSMHYITRFFGFFLIRWDDEPNRRGSPLEKRLRELLGKEITWSGPHIGGRKTWGEAAKGEGGP